MLSFADPGPAAPVSEALDRAMLAALGQTVQLATAALDAYDYTRALETTERFFWDFCDDYVELVKARAYGELAGDAGARSARAALRLALSVQLRLFAPFLPFVTEEAWSWWRSDSVHTATWPRRDELGAVAAGSDAFGAASAAIGAVRKAKSEAHVSMRTEVSRARIAWRPEGLEFLRSVLGDVQAAGRIDAVDLEPDATAEAPTVELAISPNTG